MIPLDFTVMVTFPAFFAFLWLIAGTGITYNKDIIYAVSERGGVMVTIKEIAKIL